MSEFIAFSVSGGFWRFFGCYIFVALFYGLPLKLIFKSWNRKLRSENIKTKGWPPSHLDADGDFRVESE